MAAPQVGELLEGKYRVERVIGEGAWGEVLEATNVRIKRRVAIKILKQQYASNPAMVSRFEREALASTHIESAHVVQIFDAGVLGDGRPYMVMEFLVGADLGKRIDAAPGGLPLVEAVGFCIQAARGLSAAHAASIFHRDMKPSNIVIAKTKTGRELAKIVDFGISKLLNDPSSSASNTQTGTIMGSPVYMSPEQARGAKNTDHRSDLYSLGVVLYECVTGRTPFVADSFNELLFKIALEEPPPPKTLRKELDDELNDLILKAMARTPEARFQTAAELEHALTEWLKNSGDVASGDWLHDTGGRASDLTASPTRGKSMPEILAASPLAGQSPTPTAPNAKTLLEVGNRETGTSLSKTADDAKDKATPLASSPKRFIYMGVAAVVIVVGVFGVSRLTAGNATTPEVKPDLKPATSNVVVDSTAAVTATPTPTPTPTPTEVPKPVEVVADAGPAAPVEAPKSGTGKIAAPRPTAAPPKPSTSAAPPPSSTSVGGRTIRTDF